MIGIYLITSKVNPNKVYVGSSINITKRWQAHLYKLSVNKHHSAALQNHVNKYGIDDLTFSIICETCKEDIIKKEQFFIDTLNPKFNINKKAGKCSYAKSSEKTKAYLSQIRKGIPKSDKDKLRQSERMSGNKNSMYGKHHSEETKEKLRKLFKGKPTGRNTISAKTRIGAKIKNSVSVIQYTLEGIFIKEWKSMIDVQNSLGINRVSVGMCCRGETKKAGNYIFKYKIND